MDVFVTFVTFISFIFNKLMSMSSAIGPCISNTSSSALHTRVLLSPKLQSSPYNKPNHWNLHLISARSKKGNEGIVGHYGMSLWDI